jgi:hypothetical protein
MAKNPLQQYFRQPKIFISLPSQGVYSKPGSIDGDPTKLPVFGMTGMDEIMLKTADGLLSGDSTASVINSCCPSIVDPWELSTLDIDLILASIRIATYGEELAMIKTCSECGTENEYAIKLSKFIDHFSSCEYHNVVEVGDLKVTIRPLTYRQSQDFSFKNFMLQQKIFQLSEIKNEKDKKKSSEDLVKELTVTRNEVFATGIESVDTGHEVVTDRKFINEWLANIDSNIVKIISDHVEQNKKAWTMAPQPVVCENCGHESTLSVELDQSNFFGNA